MFPDKDESGGPVGVAEAPIENAGMVSMDDATRERRAIDMAPEGGSPWTPLEDAKEEEIDDLLQNFKEGDISELIAEYFDEVCQTQNILKNFKNSPINKKSENYVYLRKKNKYLNDFNSEIKKRSLEYQSEFFERVDGLLAEKGINNRESLLAEAQEAEEAHIRKIREEDEAQRRRERSAREKTVSQKLAEPTGFLKKFFR